MPDDPKAELERRKNLRAKTAWGSSLYHGKPRQTAIGGNIPVERSDDPWGKEKKKGKV
jgi:hypothetical protein